MDTESGQVLVPDSTTGTVAIIDPETRQTVLSEYCGSGPEWVAVDSTAKRAYVLSRDGSVAAIDSTTGTLVGRTTLNPGIMNDIGVDPTAGQVYVAGPEKAVSVLDSKSLSLKETLKFDDYPKAIAADPSLGRVYVTFAVGNFVAVIDVESRSLIGRFPTGGASPTGVAVDPQTHRVYIANRDTGTISVLEPE